MTLPLYTTPFALTSQFPFCALPLRLDTYRGCSFRCTYCFARYRGGNSPDEAVRPADPRPIEHAFDRALHGATASLGIVGQFLRRRVPLHFGGMSDPFQPAELRFGSTELVLRVIARHQYPTVLSTRSKLIVQEPYFSLLREIQPLVIQISFSTTDDRVARRLEPRCEPPTRMLRAIERLVAVGINVTCRWQPFVPGLSEDPKHFVRRVANAGCKHLGFEHLKLPLETNHPLWRELAEATGRDLHEDYIGLGAKRDGREYILPWNQKLQRVAEVSKYVRAAGMTFGAADNEFQHFSDTAACCSGVDQFRGFQNFFRHQIGYAVRKSRGRPNIEYEVIRDEWAPRGSIDRFLNSRTRMSGQGKALGTLREHVLARWNNPRAPGSPASFFGVDTPREGSRKWPLIYGWTVHHSRSKPANSTAAEPLA